MKKVSYEARRFVGDHKPAQRGDRCHRCGQSHFRSWEPYHPVMLHWVLNPGLAFNELVLGQRVPRRILICRNCGDWNSQEFQFVRCESCDRLHSLKIWVGRNSFRNWFGLVCPDCGESIPCLANLTSTLICVAVCPISLPIYLCCRGRYREWSQQRSQVARHSAFLENPAGVD